MILMILFSFHIEKKTRRKQTLDFTQKFFLALIFVIVLCANKFFFSAYPPQFF